MRKELAGLAAEGDLGNRLIVTGGLLPQEVAEWISASDLLTLPSWSEGYPNVRSKRLRAAGRWLRPMSAEPGRSSTPRTAC